MNPISNKGTLALLFCVVLLNLTGVYGWTAEAGGEKGKSFRQLISAAKKAQKENRFEEAMTYYDEAIQKSETYGKEDSRYFEAV